MSSPADRSRRPRRFFGWQGVVRMLRRAPAGEETRAHRPSPTDADRALQTERARFVANVDRELRLACRSEAMVRRELGAAARAFIRGRAIDRLGFVRLSDYARERLGVSAATLRSAAWLVTRLDELPAVSTAYDRSELSWAKARAICAVAVAADEEHWLALARRSTVETLERLVARAKHPDGVPADPDGDANEIDGEPAVRWRFVCPARVRALWRRALELASRAAGEPLPDWRAAEIVAAEGSSGRPAGMSLGDRAVLEALRLARRARRRVSEAVGRDVVTRHGERAAVDALPTFALVGDEPSAAAPVPADAAPAPSDAFSLDARLTEAMRVLRTIEPRIGRLLSVIIDHRFYSSLGCPSFDDYARERLGISARKAWALRKLEKATRRSAEFDRAYRDGRLSWVRALALLPVLERSTASAWVERAESVTVRRLCDEVDWVLASRDALGTGTSLAPPPVDSQLPSPNLAAPDLASESTATLSVTSPGECRDTPDGCRDLSPHARLQIRAHENPSALAVAVERQNAALPPKALEVADAEIRFTAPASVVALLRDVLDAFAQPEEPRWSALERLLRHVITHWESTPRHHDPVFARDGWRCTVPACSSRRNLHDHHIRFRSRGGDNLRDNRTTVCAAHHLHGIHDGTIHASGVAPHAIEWRLGVRASAPPFLVYVGDRIIPPVGTRKSAVV